MRSSRRWLKVLAAAALPGLLALRVAAAPVALAPGDAAPPLSGARSPDGQPYAADWSASPITLVNFWATWCLPCKEEMRHLQQLHARLAERGLTILGVHDQAEAERVPAFVADLGTTYPLVGIGPRVDRAWGGIGTMPTSFLVASDGRILRRYVGATPEQTQGLIADVEATLAGEPLPPQVMPRAVATTPEIAPPAAGR